jgi:hypothetical protein
VSNSVLNIPVALTGFQYLVKEIRAGCDIIRMKKGCKRLAEDFARFVPEHPRYIGRYIAKGPCVGNRKDIVVRIFHVGAKALFSPQNGPLSFLVPVPLSEKEPGQYNGYREEGRQQDEHFEHLGPPPLQVIQGSQADDDIQGNGEGQFAEGEGALDRVEAAFGSVGPDGLARLNEPQEAGSFCLGPRLNPFSRQFRVACHQSHLCIEQGDGTVAAHIDFPKAFGQMIKSDAGIDQATKGTVRPIEAAGKNDHPFPGNAPGERFRDDQSCLRVVPQVFEIIPVGKACRGYRRGFRTVDCISGGIGDAEGYDLRMPGKLSQDGGIKL